MRANRYKLGYTLVEAMIAVAILSLIILMVYSSVSAVLDAHEGGSRTAENVHRERMAMKAIEDALACAVWYEYQTEETIRVDADGPFSSLKVLSRVPPRFWGERTLGGHPLRRIEFFTEKSPTGKDQLVMVQQALPTGTESLQSYRTVLLPRLENFVVEVQEKPKKTVTNSRPSANSTNSIPVWQRQPWLSSWHRTNALPSAVRVSLAESEEAPRQKIFPIFAHLAKHAKPPRQILRLSAKRFESDGFPGAGSEDGAKVVFIIDKSVSMNVGNLNRLAIAKNGVSASLNKMAQSGGRKFGIYTYNKFYDSFGPQLPRADSENVVEAKEWLKTQKVDRSMPGKQGIIECIQKIFCEENRPTEVWLVADQNFLYNGKNNSLDVPGALNALNSQKVPFNVVLLQGFGQDLGSILSTPKGAEMLRIVNENKGTIYPVNRTY